MALNTAYYRKIAREESEKGNFKLAAQYYQLAIDKYPNREGQLAEADIKNLTQNMQSCLIMCKK